MRRTHLLQDSLPAPLLLRAATLVLLAACGDAVPPETARPPAEREPVAASPHYLREFVFVGELADTALVVPFSFSAWQERQDGENGGQVARSARAWLAHGGTWDPFLNESVSSPGESGVWRVVPTRELRVVAGGSTEIEALLFRRGERTLRLQLGEPLSDWSRGEDARYRIFGGRLELRGRTVAGPVLEVQRVVALSPGEGIAEGDYDWLFLSDGGGLRLLLAEALGGATPAAETFAWVMTAEGERTGERAEIRWLEMLEFAPARREIPLRWSYQVPEAGVEGEVWSLGYHAEVGAERGGRRTVEIRYTVEGWVSLDGEQRRVVGMIRHSQS